MSLLVPDTGLLFWMIISFSIVFFILAKYGFPIITKAVEKRNNYIENSLEAARMAEEKLATINRQAEAVMQEALGRRNALLDEAQEIKHRMVNEAKEAAETEKRLRITKATAEIEEMRKRAIVGIKDDVVGLSIKVAEKVLGEELHDSNKQRTLINRILDEELVTNS